MFWDYWYIVLVLPALLLSMIAQFKVRSAYTEYAKVRTFRGMTGKEIAEYVLRVNGVYDVAVLPTKGTMTDHFDPRQRVIKLSQGVYDSSSVAAIGIAAHEAGHACQHAEGYKPVILRTKLVPAVQFGSKVSMPLILIGLIFYTATFSHFLVMLGVLFFSLTAIFQLVTLPVEFNASSRAVKALEGSYMFHEEEMKGAKKVLKAAAMTYVASLMVSIASLLRILLLTQRRGRR